MAVSTQDIVDFLQANPGMSDADIAKAMEQYGVSPAQMAEATGLSLNEVNSRLAAVGMFAPQTQPTRVIPTARGTVIEGDNIDAQIAGIPQVVYETKVDPNNTANWQTVNPTTGEVINSGTFAGGGDRGLMAAAAPVIGLAASTVGLPFISGALGGLTGATGSTLAGLTGATISGGTSALAGGSTEDILKAALTGGLGAYGGSVLGDYVSANTPIDASTMSPEKFNDLLEGNLVKDMQAAGLNNQQISAFLDDMGIGQGLTDAASVVTNNVTPTTTIPTTTAPDVVNIVGSTTPAINAGGLLSSIVNTTPTVTPTTTPTTPVTEAGTVEVQGTSTPQQVDQSVLNLINSQLATNVTTPTTLPTQQTPLANVEVTGDKGLMSGDTTVTDILNTLAGIPTTPVTTPAVPEQVITDKATNTNQNVIDTLTSLLPSITNTPVTVPTTPVVPEQVITAETPVKTEDIISAITPVIPTVTPTVTTPTTPVTPEVVVTDKITTPTIEDFVTPITSLLPTITPPVTTPVTTPTVTPVVTPETPTQTIIAEKPTTITDVVTPAVIPTITPTTPLTPTPVTTEPTNKTTNPLGLTDAQLFNILKAGLGLFGSVAATGGGSRPRSIGALPTQGVPQYSQDYFNQVQQNYNRLLPSTPRDVSSPLQDWYNSQYGA